MYRRAELVQDETTPILVPAAVALIVAGLCIAASILLIPWDSIPTPTVCHDEEVRSMFGRLKEVTKVCAADTSDRTAAGFAAGLVSLGAIFLSVVFTIRALTVGRNVH